MVSLPPSLPPATPCTQRRRRPDRGRRPPPVPGACGTGPPWAGGGAWRPRRRHLQHHRPALCVQGAAAPGQQQAAAQATGFACRGGLLRSRAPMSADIAQPRSDFRCLGAASCCRLFSVPQDQYIELNTWVRPTAHLYGAGERSSTTTYITVRAGSLAGPRWHRWAIHTCSAVHLLPWSLHFHLPCCRASLLPQQPARLGAL